MDWPSKHDACNKYDGRLERYFLLKEYFTKRGFECINASSDKKSNASIYVDTIPTEGEIVSEQNYFIFLEPSSVMPLSHDSNAHNIFDLVFTPFSEFYTDKYIEVAASPVPEVVVQSETPFSQKKLCCMIVANKMSLHPRELYTERLKMISYFNSTKTRVNDFDLYGKKWNRPVRPFKQSVVAHRKLQGYIRYIKYLVFFLRRNRVYQGAVQNKLSVQGKYLFSICFENQYGEPGYITEKIFDCFRAGSIPIYYGAPDIDRYIPKKCYIDYRDFSSIGELYRFMNAYTQTDYEKYIAAVKEFVGSGSAEHFYSRKFADTIGRVVTERLET